MKNIHKPKFKPAPDRDAELDRLIARANYICEHYPDSSIRRTILARYEQEMDELSKKMLGKEATSNDAQ